MSARAAYGYCPECGQPGITRARTLDAWTTCSNGHRTLGRDMLPDPPWSTGTARTDELIRLLSRVAELEAEVERLRAVIRETHAGCEPFAVYGRHAPECKLYELEEDPARAALRPRAEAVEAARWVDLREPDDVAVTELEERAAVIAHELLRLAGEVERG